MATRRRAPRRNKTPTRKAAARPAVAVPTTTYYDPVRKCVVDARGNTVTLAVERPRPLTQYPAPLVPKEHLARLTDQRLLYACETATLATVEGLAKVANSTVADLEWRRRSWQNPPRMAGVPIPETWCGSHARQAITTVPTDRRLCLSCPLWTANPDVSPF